MMVTKDKHNIHVIIDDREANSRTVEEFKKIDGVDIAIQHLALGDYEIDGRLIFERKTLIDFANSFKDGRLFRQASRLASNEKRSAIILEGTSSDLINSGMRREAIQGALITISFVFGLPILRSKDPQESAKLMLYTAKQVQLISTGALPHRGKRSKGKRKVQLQLLQGIPGIGPKRAEKLLETFSNVENVITANLDELLKISGIGENTAKTIRWAVSENKQGYKYSDDPII
jgi:ERCC4-type nuclease